MMGVMSGDCLRKQLKFCHQSLKSLKCFLIQGPRSKFLSGGAEEECVKENFGGGRGGGHACGFLFNYSKVTENANNDKTIDFFPHLQ